MTATCAKCGVATTTPLTYGGKAKKVYGGGVCGTCVKGGAAG